MKRGRKKKVIVPESVSQHIEEEFKNNSKFRKAYRDEITRLNLAYKIAQLRKKRHLTQAQLAKRVKTTQQNISRLEDFKNIEITISTLSKIALALDMRLKIEFKDRLDELRDKGTLKMVAQGRKAINRGAKGIPVSKVLKK